MIVSENVVRELTEKAMRLRYYILKMVGIGKSGHLGGSASCVEIITSLYFNWMSVDYKNPKNPERDILVLSKGHGALAQYAALTEIGYISKNELEKTKSIGSILQGHPDMRKTPGIEANTGSLGQGLSIGLGMALGLNLDNKKNRVYVLLGDGELCEGQVWEAVMAASNYSVDNLIAIVDHNKLLATGNISERFNIMPLVDKWKSFGWNTFEIDGHNFYEIINALYEASNLKGKPSVIIAHTIKGKGFLFAENNPSYHNVLLTEKEYNELENYFKELLKGAEEI